MKFLKEIKDPSGNSRNLEKIFHPCTFQEKSYRHLCSIISKDRDGLGHQVIPPPRIILDVITMDKVGPHGKMVRVGLPVKTENGSWPC